MKRSDSSRPQFVQRIPADVRQAAIGRVLAVPLGPETVHVPIRPSTMAVRFSLRTHDPSEAKRRQGEAAASLEEHWTALRRAKPVHLTQRQATALAGELYRAWADGEEREETISVVHVGNRQWVQERPSPEEEVAGFASALKRLTATIEAGDAADLEPTLGPLAD